jgi:hypothetical protein
MPYQLSDTGIWRQSSFLTITVPVLYKSAMGTGTQYFGSNNIFGIGSTIFLDSDTNPKAHSWTRYLKKYCLSLPLCVFWNLCDRQINKFSNRKKYFFSLYKGCGSRLTSIRLRIKQFSLIRPRKSLNPDPIWIRIHNRTSEGKFLSKNFKI